jgi:hypothetical protein
MRNEIFWNIDVPLPLGRDVRPEDRGAVFLVNDRAWGPVVACYLDETCEVLVVRNGINGYFSTINREPAVCSAITAWARLDLPPEWTA